MLVTIHQCSTNPLYAALFYGAPPLTSWRQIAEEQHFFFRSARIESKLRRGSTRTIGRSSAVCFIVTK
jgi:hypothetical protein